VQAVALNGFFRAQADFEFNWLSLVEEHPPIQWPQNGTKMKGGAKILERL
jgi:hypothetical protein